VSEVFPLEMRAIAISLFYAAGTALGGFIGPPLYGAMIESGSRSALFGAYAFAAALMLIAAIVTLFLGVMQSANHSTKSVRRSASVRKVRR
jgi:MFS family permease